jgi:hypothetical protein
MFPAKGALMNKAIYGTLVGLILLGTFFLGRLSSASNLAARCAVTIPSEWGDYAGANQYGIVFKDSDGTLRVVKMCLAAGMMLLPTSTWKFAENNSRVRHCEWLLGQAFLQEKA